jgi:hypothetical protein
VDAGAPLASDNDNPAAPNKGTAHARRFCFEACFGWAMKESSHTFRANVRLLQPTQRPATGSMNRSAAGSEVTPGGVANLGRQHFNPR